MRVGKLRHRIEIYKFDEIRNEYGEAEKKELFVKKVWAFIDAVKSDEKYIQNKQMSEVTYKLEIRYLKGLDESFFIKFKGEVFDIKSIINPYEKNQRLLLVCIKRQRDYKDV
ncbi:phage head closure protein [Campylobacter ureolyticus]|uniref:phage head closure protein n=1 Tax=Campylobacter ureolyticus TaxID=827 RepID=UPI0022B304E1|nr:phage head closure protein [Campylobacter ureolyticus]MCZ6105690.1 phage head closure protein [Campylobacter ureolyticus]